MQVKTTNISRGKDEEEEEEMTTNNMEMELTSLTLQLLTLTQDLVNAKLRMEDTAKVRGLLVKFAPSFGRGKRGAAPLNFYYGMGSKF